MEPTDLVVLRASIARDIEAVDENTALYDEIRLCVRVYFLGSPIAYLNECKILTEGVNFVTISLIILLRSLEPSWALSQKVSSRQNWLEKRKKK